MFTIFLPKLEVSVIIFANAHEPRNGPSENGKSVGCVGPLSTDVGRWQRTFSDVKTYLRYSFLFFCFLFNICARDCVLLDDCLRAFLHVLQESTVFEEHLCVCCRDLPLRRVQQHQRGLEQFLLKTSVQVVIASLLFHLFFQFPVRACLLLFSRSFCAMAKLTHRTLSCVNIVNSL